MSNRAPQRILAAVGGVACLGVVTLFLGLFALAVDWVTTRPDPWEPNGDPCCGHPDDKGDIVGGALAGAAWAVGAALVLTCALGCLAIAIRGRRPGLGWLALGPGALAVAGMGALAVLTLRNPGGPRVDCDRFHLGRVAQRDGHGEIGRGQALGIAQCGTLTGATSARVRALLGPPPATHVDGKEYWSYTTLELRFDDGRVDHARAGII
jgi:hypothetical protein